MKTNTEEKSLNISSLFSRFIVGFGAGFVGMIVLGIILFSTWKIIGDVLIPPEGAPDQLGVKVNEVQTHPLFLIIITLAIFLSTLAANLTYAFLSTVVQEEFSRRSTSLTHVFFGNLTLLIFFLPLYFSTNVVFGAQGIAISSILHIVISVFFTLSVIQSIHQSKYLMVNLYGNLFGIILFTFLVTVFSDIDTITLFFISFPFFIGSMAFGNRVIELVYAWIYKNYGTDFLNVDTNFGDDYGLHDDTSLKNDFDI